MLTWVAGTRCASTLCSCVSASIQGIRHSIKTVLGSCVRGKRKDERITVKEGRGGIKSKKTKSKERKLVEKNKRKEK